MTSDAPVVGEIADLRASDTAFVVGEDHTVVSVTDRFVERVNRSRADLVGTDSGAVVDALADGVAELHGALEAILRGDRSHSCVDVAFGAATDDTPSRQSRCVAQVTPVLDGGSLCGALVIFQSDRRARDRLAETYQRYRTLVECNRDGVTITQDGKNVFVNNRFAEMVGFSKSELVDESFLLPIAPEDHDKVTRRHERRLRGESPPNRYEMRLQTKSGDELTVEVNVAVIRYGGAPAVMATYRDVTARKQREEDLRRFRRAIETAPHAIALTDADGYITYVNPAFEDITGYTREEALDERPSLFHSEETPDSIHAEMLETIVGGDVWEGYLLNRRADGDLYHARETVAPISPDDDQEHGYVGIHTDVGDHVERERLIDTFDRVLRHNLRNRLNVIQAHGSLIRTRDDADVDEHVDAILDSTEDLLETTRKGREIISLLSQPSQQRPIDAVETVRTATRNASETRHDAQVSFETPDELFVSAVPELDAAVEELVSNAIEHSDRDEPTVSVSLSGQEDCVEIRVADDGPGISEMERAILTEPRDIDQLYHGSGFGLWLVYWIVRQSGGTIGIADRDPRGTVVTVELDRSTSANAVSSIESPLSVRTQQ